MRGVRGIGRGHPAMAQPGGLRPGRDLGQPLRAAPDHRRTGAVDRGDPYVVPVREQLGRPLLRRADGRETAPADQGRRDPAAYGDQPGTVLQRQRSGHARGRDLTLRVAHHGRRDDAERTPHLGQRDHHGPEHGLQHLRALQRGAVLGVPQYVEKVPVGVRGQGPGTAADGFGEHGRAVEQFGGHAHPLRALPREDEHRTGGRRLAGHPVDHMGGGLTGGQRVQPGQERIAVPGHHHGTVLQGRPVLGERPADVGGGDIAARRVVRRAARRTARRVVRPAARRTARRERPQPCRLRPHPGRSPARDDPWQHLTTPRPRNACFRALGE